MRDGWVETTLGEVADLVRGPFGGSLKKEIFIQTGFAVYEQHHAIYGDFSSIRYRISREKFSEMKRFALEPGDLIMSCSGTMGKVRIVPKDADAGIINQALLKISPKLSLQSEFLFLWMQSEDFIQQIEINSGGGALQNVSSVKMLKKIKLAMPKLLEQKRIVDLISSIDSYIEALEQQLESAKKSRNAVLHELLSVGGDDWVRVTLSEVCTMLKRGQAPSYTEQKSVTVLNQKCIRNGKIDFEFARQTNAELKPINDWAYLTAEDTLVNSTGVGTLGRAAFVGKLEEPLTVDSHVTIVRPDVEKILPSFLGLTLSYREADIEGFAAGSSGQTELSREALGNLIITIPPFSEQLRIVEIIFTIDELVTNTASAIYRSKMLRSGLLSDLLSGDHEIPASYDKVMEAV